MSEKVRISKKPLPSTFKDMTGQVFGLLTVETYVGSRVFPSGQQRSVWRCRCQCGTVVDKLRSDLRKSRTVGCSACAAKARGERLLTHGESYGRGRTREYRAWESAKRRCFNERDPKFPSYGGRGITMCERWRSSYESFLEDMGRVPDGHSLDREDVNGNYEPGNCRWAPATVQTRNTRRFKPISFEGADLTQAEFGALFGIEQTRVSQLLRSGLTVAEIAKKYAGKKRSGGT